jgi:hypothetical protein
MARTGEGADTRPVRTIALGCFGLVNWLAAVTLGVRAGGKFVYRCWDGCPESGWPARDQAWQWYALLVLGLLCAGGAIGLAAAFRRRSWPVPLAAELAAGSGLLVLALSDPADQLRSREYLVLVVVAALTGGALIAVHRLRRT